MLCSGFKIKCKAKQMGNFECIWMYFIAIISRDNYKQSKHYNSLVWRPDSLSIKNAIGYDWSYVALHNRFEAYS